MRQTSHSSDRDGGGSKTRCFGLVLFAFLAVGCQSSAVFPRQLANTRLNPEEVDALRPVPERIPLSGSFAWFFPSSRGDKAVMMFHGNAETVDDYAPWAAALARSGLSVALVEFPGYREATGRPTPASIRRCAVDAFDWLRDTGYAADRIAIFGRSIGAAAACDLTRVRPINTLILVSPFTSLADTLRNFGLPGVVALGRFNNRQAVSGYAGKLLVLHGREDGILPIGMGRALYLACPSEVSRTRFVTLDAGHNDLVGKYEDLLTREILAWVDE